jgi:5'-nucleotidase
MPYYWLAGKFASREPEDKQEDSDYFNLENGYITIVPAHFDLTDYKGVALLNTWNWDETKKQAKFDV